jgi:lactoylglutathione lyase
LSWTASADTVPRAKASKVAFMTQAALVEGLSHIGIRVRDYPRARKFYEFLGFKHEWGPSGPDQVAAMRHESGLELNFIVNAESDAPNVLMDVAEKHSGITHIALKIESVAAAEAALIAAGIEITGRRGSKPVNALFVRDPDRNVIELAAD